MGWGYFRLLNISSPHLASFYILRIIKCYRMNDIPTKILCVKENKVAQSLCHTTSKMNDIARNDSFSFHNHKLTSCEKSSKKLGSHKGRWFEFESRSLNAFFTFLSDQRDIIRVTCHVWDATSKKYEKVTSSDIVYSRSYDTRVAPHSSSVRGFWLENQKFLHTDTKAMFT